MNVLINQFKSLLPSFLLILLVSLVVIGFIFGLHLYNNVPLEALTNDLAAIAELPVYTGILSQTGIFIWSAAATICLFSSQFVKEKLPKTFLVTSALITLLLGLDDVFMFHELVFPALGIHQKIVFLSYGLLMLWYLIRFLRLILKTDFVMLAFALSCFALSLFVDNFMYNASPYISKLLEDGAKFIGIIAWLVYYIRISQQFILQKKPNELN
ncbi:hypothetical protein [uncultured Psychroserpens sp.]|uniref:hypothetical protein n=1 Tax=uncultured Psychroserpens sp. TaxID=255436 RepID=UPI0026371EB9|nr:hypothetical protein [uncultured Psychroserpens sp.]